MASVAAYVKELVAATVRVCAPVTTPQALDVVVAARSRRRSRVWVVTEQLSRDVSPSTFREVLEAVPPPVLERGLLAFALNGALADGVPRKPQPRDGLHPLIPGEWKAFMSDANTIEELVNRAWPEERPSLLRRWFRS
jgi:hypothetical protein